MFRRPEEALLLIKGLIKFGFAISCNLPNNVTLHSEFSILVIYFFIIPFISLKFS